MHVKSFSDIIRPLDLVAPSRPEILASDFHSRLVTWINEFEAELDEESEVAVRLVNFGQTFAFHLSDVTFWNPAMLRFDGIDNLGKPIQLIQHVTQLSVLLYKEAKLGAKATRIGFIKPDALAEE